MSDISGNGVEPGAGGVNPEAPVRTSGQRILVGVIIGLGLLILLGLGALVVGLARDLRGPSAGPGAPQARLILPPGAEIEQMQVADNRLILRIKTDTGEEIAIIDTRDGHVVSRIKAAPPAIPH